MKKYELYKDSGVEWIGEVPSHWDIKKVRSCFSERREKVSDKDFAPLSVTKAGILPQLDTAAKSDNSDNRKKVLKGDFVVNSRSDRKGSCGISEYDGSVSLINTVLTPFNILAGYVHYMFRSNNYIEEYYRHGRGIVADLWTTRYSEMKNIAIPFPTISEQQAVIDYLKDKTLKIDQYVSAREQERELLESLKQSEIANVVTKGLNSNVRMKDSGIPWIGMIPEHWELRRIKYIFSEKKEKSTTGKEMPLSLSKDKGIIPFSEKKNKTMESASYVGCKIVTKGDIVFNRFKARLFAISDYDGLVSSDYAVYCCNNTASLKYIVKLLSTEMYREAFNRKASGIGDGFSRLYTEDLFAFYAIFPPLEEQQAIVDYIEAKLSKIDSFMVDLQAEIDYLKEFKQRLISDVVTGQICVSNHYKKVSTENQL